MLEELLARAQLRSFAHETHCCVELKVVAWCAEAARRGKGSIEVLLPRVGVVQMLLRRLVGGVLAVERVVLQLVAMLKRLAWRRRAVVTRVHAIVVVIVVYGKSRLGWLSSSCKTWGSRY